MRRTIAASLTLALAALFGSVGLLSPAGATSALWTYSATSGGTQANLLGSTVSTDLTGASNIGGTQFTNSANNGVAGVSVPGLISVGAVTTSQNAAPYGTNGIQITSKAQIAGINLLGGAIKVGAVTETNVVTATPEGGFTNAVTSELATLSIGGKSYPITVSPNTTITIPGLATVTINKQLFPHSASSAQSTVAALQITLLKDVAGGKLGSTITLAPSTINMMSGLPSNAIAVGGFAYGSAAFVSALDAKVAVPATALLQIPTIGTGGKLYTNSTAAVNVPGILKVGAIQSQISGLSAVGSSDAFASSEIANASVLNGLITADAIKVTSHVSKNGDTHSESQALTFVNLKIAGKVIPINVKPNTKINILNVAEVIVNQQISQSGYSMIVGVRIIVVGKNLGLPVGADIQLGVASTYTAAT
jgi:hypothetical protein